MPPSPQPTESREQATIRWLTLLLAALVDQTESKSVLVHRESLAADHDGYDLMESRGSKGDILLRFEATQHLAIYPLNGGTVWQDPKEPKTSRAAATPDPAAAESSRSSNPPSQPGTTAPKDQQTIQQLERALQKQKMVNQIIAGRLRQEQQKRQSLEGLLENAEILQPTRK